MELSQKKSITGGKGFIGYTLSSSCMEMKCDLCGSGLTNQPHAPDTMAAWLGMDCIASGIISEAVIL